MDKAGHDKLRARRCFMTMAATAHRPLPWLELRQWHVGEVEKVMAERCAQAITQWHGGSGVRARWSLAMAIAVLSLLLQVKERQREGERARVSEHGGFASLFSPCWPDQPGRHWCATTTGCTRPGAVGHDDLPIQLIDSATSFLYIS